MYCIATLTSILQRQQTPIHVAVENGFQESVEVLLAGGADLNCREKVYLFIFVYPDIVGHHYKNTGCFYDNKMSHLHHPKYLNSTSNSTDREIRFRLYKQP